MPVTNKLHKDMPVQLMKFHIVRYATFVAESIEIQSQFQFSVAILKWLKHNSDVEL